MESEVDEILAAPGNIWTEWLLRPKKIGFKYESPFDLEEPQFEIRLPLTPQAVIRAYAWLRHALIYCGYQVYKPNGDDLTLFRQDYETKHYVYNYMLDRMAQTIFQFAEWLSTYHPSVSGSEVTLKKSNRSSLSSKKSTIALSQEAVAGVTDLAEGYAPPAKPTKSKDKSSKLTTDFTTRPRTRGVAAQTTKRKSKSSKRMKAIDSSSDSERSSGDSSEQPSGSDDDDWAPSRNSRHGSVNVMSVDSLPIFHGDEGGSEAAYHWIQRFELLADTSRWNDKAKISWFASYLGKPVRTWLKQKLFVREWIKSPTSKSDKYLHMIQEPGESLKSFFYRFNSAAITANVRYWKYQDVLDDHISKFCSALEDVALGDQLSQMSFPNIGALERYLDAQRKKIALRRLKTRYAQHALQKVQDPLRGLRPPPSKVDMDRRARERERREQQRYQVHLAVEDSDDDMAVPTPKTDNEIYTMGGKKE
ncbi:unnamed protein product [Aphanomyces euteiches]